MLEENNIHTILTACDSRGVLYTYNNTTHTLSRYIRDSYDYIVSTTKYIGDSFYGEMLTVGDRLHLLASNHILTVNSESLGEPHTLSVFDGLKTMSATDGDLWLMDISNSTLYRWNKDKLEKSFIMDDVVNSIKSSGTHIVVTGEHITSIDVTTKELNKMSPQLSDNFAVSHVTDDSMLLVDIGSDKARLVNMRSGDISNINIPTGMDVLTFNSIVNGETLYLTLQHKDPLETGNVVGVYNSMFDFWQLKNKIPSPGHGDDFGTGMYVVDDILIITSPVVRVSTAYTRCINIYDLNTLELKKIIDI